MEFDWGDEDENTKSRKYKPIYSDGLRVKELNVPALDELNNMGLQADIFMSIMGASFNYKRKEHEV